ncbi:hypothetical protein A3F66_07020 [candidate division TM6 bacterium RIFCSPHIGHO2_12_FULL_32_22]|nr:MAG: hypothetical protein A3F66_07020 [candidate division TM6 bacterium RIFCSPHIGHO2_12_FULL_32_22]
MLQLILHGIGDYITQNEWMALNKGKNTIKGYFACWLHATIYSLPFLLIGSLNSFFFIYVSHFLIDKYRLAIPLIKLKNWNWKSKNFGFNSETPAWMAVWLFIIIDNLLHIICNYLALRYL